jgi:hypothetical protein
MLWFDLIRTWVLARCYVTSKLYRAACYGRRVRAGTNGPELTTGECYREIFNRSLISTHSPSIRRAQPAPKVSILPVRHHHVPEPMLDGHHCSSDLQLMNHSATGYQHMFTCGIGNDTCVRLWSAVLSTLA